MAKTKQERIESIQDEIKELRNQKKMLLQQHKLDAAIKAFNFAGTGYCFDASPGRLTYLFHDPERFWKWIRPVRKQ